jgi:hypothetical protein
MFAASGLVIAGLILGLAVPAAAGEAKHLINGSSIKAHTITGKQIKNNAITGAQVKESTLGAVPNATKLGGKAASAYQKALKSTCAGGQAINSVGSDGTVTCTGNLQSQISADCTGSSIDRIDASGDTHCTGSETVPFYYFINTSDAHPYRVNEPIGNTGLTLTVGCHDPATEFAFGNQSGNGSATANWSYSLGGASSTVNASGAVISHGGTDAIFTFTGTGNRIEGQVILSVAGTAPNTEEVATVTFHGYDDGTSCEFIGSEQIGATASND